MERPGRLWSDFGDQNVNQNRLEAMQEGLKANARVQ